MDKSILLMLVVATFWPIASSSPLSELRRMLGLKRQYYYYDTSPSPASGACSYDQFKCDYYGYPTCHPNSYHCDGYNDCDDQSDEMYCPNTSPAYPSPASGDCSYDQFKCDYYGYPTCHPNSYHCDGYNDCDDRSDEMYCPDCMSGFQCYNYGFKTCLSQEMLCNGMSDCDNGADEYSCPGSSMTFTPSPSSSYGGCGYDEFQCYSYGFLNCYHNSSKCDGYSDCDDHYDEMNCPGCPYDTDIGYYYSDMCETGSMQCFDQTCHDKSSFCDGHRDCSKGEDEIFCYGFDVCVSAARKRSKDLKRNLDERELRFQVYRAAMAAHTKGKQKRRIKEDKRSDNNWKRSKLDKLVMRKIDRLFQTRKQNSIAKNRK